MYKSLIRPLLYSLDPEVAHHFVLSSSAPFNSGPLQRGLKAFYKLEDPRLEVTFCGLKFKNPLGLAAGFDKNAQAVGLFSALGFGHVELGSITGQAQPGNPKPRIFRFPKSEALINRMGFPSEGSDIVSARLKNIFASKSRPVIGVNLGKTKAAPLDKALDDYLYSFARIKEYADYYVLNVSSPNTPELRKLQEPERLKELFQGIQAMNSLKRPLLVKISPDLSDNELDQVLDIALSCGISGLIATNTTLSREGFADGTQETGGLSGAPLRSRSLSMVHSIFKRSGGKVPIIGVGGVFCAQDVVNLMRAGASLVQIYSGLVYEGPGLIKRIQRDLLGILDREEIRQLSDLIPKNA